MLCYWCYVFYVGGKYVIFGIGLFDVKKERNLEIFFGGWGLNVFLLWLCIIIKCVL